VIVEVADAPPDVILDAAVAFMADAGAVVALTAVDGELIDVVSPAVALLLIVVVVEVVDIGRTSFEVVESIWRTWIQASSKESASHGVQVDEPVDPAYVPAAHDVQVELPSAVPYFPDEQLVHVDEPVEPE
jgi:acyl-CoA hydrolase